MNIENSQNVQDVENMNKLLSEFESFLKSNLPKAPSFHPFYEKALAKMLEAGGKRFRPMLLLSVVEAKNKMLIKNAMQVALGLEYLHTYSLIHDDLPAMDDAPLRRGQETLHITYDETSAILVGDALNTEAFGLISKAALSNDIKIELISSLSENGGINGMVLGQAIDCYFENKKLDLEQINFLHIHKTAKLIACSLKMGAIIASYDIKTQNEIYDFGINLGLLFQIQDDILDITQSSKKAGKTTQNDTEKNSFVNLLGLEGAKSSADELANKCILQIDTFDANLKKALKGLLSEYFFRHC